MQVASTQLRSQVGIQSATAFLHCATERLTCRALAAAARLQLWSAAFPHSQVETRGLPGLTPPALPASQALVTMPKVSSLVIPSFLHDYSTLLQACGEFLSFILPWLSLSVQLYIPGKHAQHKAGSSFGSSACSAMQLNSRLLQALFSLKLLW